VGTGVLFFFIEVTHMQSQTYNYKVVRQFAIMTVVWGIVGMLVGVIAAAQLVWPELNVAEWLHFGRLRPLHTNAVIFAFGGCALFATSYYCVQRTCHTRCSPRALLPSPSGAGSWSSCLRRSPCRSVTPHPRNTPSSSGRSTS
jgi:cytochrome c oxidase cbb3-type subunit 1